MKTYILAVAGVILLSAVLTMIAPSGRMGKFIKGTMKLFILVVMISPVVSWVKGGTLDLSAASKIASDEEYLRACAEKLAEEDEAEISAFVAEEFLVECDVEVARKTDAYFTREKIRIFVRGDGINAEDGHKHILTDIREAVEARYGTETEVT